MCCDVVGIVGGSDGGPGNNEWTYRGPVSVVCRWAPIKSILTD